MTFPLPEGDLVRKAFLWIHEKRQETPRPALVDLVESAGKKFNLSPKECEYLFDFYSKPVEDDC